MRVLDVFRERLSRAADVKEAIPMEFAPSRPVTIAAAPGRLDVMGGVADYSGSLVAEATIAESTRVAAQLRTDSLVRVFSREFLDRYGETGEAATSVAPDEVYTPLAAAEHPVRENQRVANFIDYLAAVRMLRAATMCANR